MNYELGEFRLDVQNVRKFLLSNILLYCAVLLLVLKIALIGVSLNIPFNIFFADITKITLENLANQTRQSLGLGVLIRSQKLDEAAKLKAEDMVKNGYFEHTSPTGVSPWFWFSKTRYDYEYAGENLAIGFYDSTEVYNAWLDSPAHKANLLNPNYKEFGTAIAGGFGNNNTVVVVQLFGSPKPEIASPEKNSVAVKSPEAVQQPKPIIEPKEILPEKVLSQSTQEIKPFEGATKLVQDIIFGVSLVVIGALLFLLLFSTDFKTDKKLVLRPLAILIFLGFSSIINKDLIILIIPHQLII